MTLSLSSLEKLEKLTKVSLYKRWSPHIFLRLCNQLQETSDFENPSIVGKALFSAGISSAGIITGTGPLEPLFLQYICYLSSDPKSLFPLPNLIAFLQSGDDIQIPEKIKCDVLIFIAKMLPSGGALSSMISSDQFTTILTDYMKEISTIDLAKALAYLLIRLAESGYDPVIIIGGESVTTGGEGVVNGKSVNNHHQNSLYQFYTCLQKILRLVTDDPFLQKRLKLTYRNVFKNATNSDSDENGNGSGIDLVGGRGSDVIIGGVGVTGIGGLGGVDGINGVNIGGRIKGSRAFRLLWLESVMLTASKIQGNSFLREIKTFFAGESIQIIISSLIATAFDCLAVALQRKDSPIYIPLWKGFIGKRLPIIIKRLASSLDNNPSSFSSLETCICNPIRLLDRGTVNLVRIYGGGDALDEMFSSFPSTTSDIRHEFLKSCVELNLINSECLKSALGEEANIVEDNSKPSYGPPGSKYITRPSNSGAAGQGHLVTIDEIFRLASQENSEHVAFDDSIAVWLVKSFEDLDGYRQQKVARKLLKSVEEWAVNSSQQQQACLSRFCQALSLKTDTLDILFLHITPTSLLIPLINSLDEWKDEDDENNFQEIYTNIGSIFLFIEVVYRRYALCKEDLLLTKESSSDKKSFWLDCITDGIRDAMLIEDMSENRKSLLGGWISALYDAGGISDDLMRLSSIQELVILIPSVFQQSVTACAANIIDQDTLKGGLDYFLQPFLLPTLLGAFRYLGDCLWLSKDLAQVLWVLNLLISPGGLSSEATNIHKIVLSIVAIDLRTAILDVKSRTSKDHGMIDQILIGLEPHANATGRFAPIIPHSNNLVRTMKDTINILVGWIQALDQGHISGAPGYNLRCFSLASEILGSRKLLDLFLDELDFAEAQGTFEYALDVLSGLILTMDTVSQHDNGGISDKMESSLLELVDKIPEESVLKQREQKRRRDNSGGSSSTTVASTTAASASFTGTTTVTSNITTTNNGTTNINLLIGGFQKFKKRIEDLLEFRKKQQEILSGNNDEEEEDFEEEDIEQGEETDNLLQKMGFNDDLTNNDNNNILGNPSVTNAITASSLESSAIDVDLDDNGGGMDIEGLDDMGLMGDLDIGMGDDDLGVGLDGELDMSGFDNDEQLMLMDLS